MFTFKGIASSSHLRELKVGHSVLPPSNVKMLEIEGKAGAYFLKKTHGVRTITVEVAVIGTSQSNLRAKVREIADWLDSDKPEKLYFSDEPDVYYMAILSEETDLEQIVNLGTGELTFICLDPYAFRYNVNVSLTAGATKTVPYYGTAKTFPVITATATVATNLLLISRGDNFGNDDKVELTHSFAVGDVVEIDMEKGTVKVNGTINMPIVTLDSDFWSLSKGDNFVWASGNFTYSLKYTERLK